MNEREFRSAYASKSEHLIVGLMSGTSLDGVDAVLTSITTDERDKPVSVRMVKHYYLPYSPALRERVGRLCTLAGARIDDLTYAHFGLSEWYAVATLRVIAAAGLKAEDIDAVSMHGQTVWHAPTALPFPGPNGDIPVKGTLQLGSSAVVAERTGLPVVADLRARDMAAGGEGAPLSPYIDALLFGHPTEGRIVQNIGGIGNATVIPSGATNDGVTAFDTGPGNMIMDEVVRLGTEGESGYDEGGKLAAQGRVAEDLVESLMRDPFFARQPPKSTGREVYGADFTQAFVADCAGRGLSLADRVATATAFTAESIARSYRDFVLPTCPIARVLVCGGGALNDTLLRMIGQRLPGGIQVTTTTAFGVPDQAREALAFALLGHESLMGRAGNLPAVTGAKRPVVLGDLTL